MHPFLEQTISLFAAAKVKTIFLYKNIFSLFLFIFQ